MNSNVLHRWLKDDRQRAPVLSDGAPAPAFIPIDLAASLSVSVRNSEPSAPPPSDIRIELQHHAMTVTVHWPVVAAACPDAAMIRIDAAWLATAPLDMRAGTDTALARVVPDGQFKFPHPWPPQIPPGRTTRL